MRPQHSLVALGVCIAVTCLGLAVAGLDARRPPAAVAAGAANPRLASLPDNTALDLGRYRCDSSAAAPPGCEAITDYSGFTYDSRRHVMLLFGGGHATTFRDDVDVFDFDQLTWTSAYTTTACAAMTADNVDFDVGRWRSTNQPLSRHSYDQLVFAENTGELLLLAPGSGRGNCAPDLRTPNGNDAFFAAGTVPAYDIDARTWSYSAARPDWGYAATAEYDPPSGRAVIVSQYGLWTYDPVTRLAAKHREQFPGDLGYAANLVYYPPDQRLYYIARGSPTRVFVVTPNRADWSGSTVAEVTSIAGTAPDSQESGWAYDAANQVIGGGIRDGVFWAFDPRRKEWLHETMRPDSPTGLAIGTVAFHALAYDPVDNVYLFLTDGVSGRHTWAYRWRAASGPEPTPSATPEMRATATPWRVVLPWLWGD